MQHGALHGAFANASVGMPGLSWNTLNPAASGSVHRGVLSVHTVQAYGLSALDFRALQVIFPVGQHSLLLNGKQLGFSAYTETLLEAGIATLLTPGTTRRLHAALLGSWKQTNIREYGTAQLYALTFGIQLAIAHNLHFGATGRHFAQFYAGQSEDAVQLPKSLAIGFAYQPVHGVWLMAAQVQEQFFNSALRFGIELSPVSSVHFRCGFTNEPLKYALGIGIKLPWLVIDLAAERHVVLGWTPGLSINLVFMRPKDE